jgi:hypothetical protein
VKKVKEKAGLKEKPAKGSRDLEPKRTGG